MRILLVADGRSPTARRWIAGLVALEYEVHLVSTFPCEPVPGLTGQDLIAAAFSRFAAQRKESGPARVRGGDARLLLALIKRFRSVFMTGRYWAGPLSVRLEHGHFARIAAAVKPDLVHALRIPFEGMLASSLPANLPLAVSIWGNDLILHARGSPLMRAATTAALRRANGLLADTQRDLDLAPSFGFDPNRPRLVVPGSGGLDLAEINQPVRGAYAVFSHGLPAGVPLVINPRGFRPGSLRSDVFFRAIPLVLQRVPQAVFVCPTMAGQPEAEHWVNQLGIGAHVRLLPVLSQPHLWDLFQRSQVFVSPSIFDGTPNSLLEAMACGCFPVAGDIPSMREWILPGKNGLLAQADDPQSLADTIASALENTDLRRSAAEWNQRMVRERADISQVRPRVAEFYARMLK
jgi:glycosyltransferase involved in cell wall biosynthesis